MLRRHSVVNSVFMFFLVLALAGCGSGGGGGGDGGGGTTPDTVPPTVLNVTPANGATDIAVTTTVSVNFSEATDCSTVTSTNVTLASKGGAVTGSVACTGSSATFAPASNLADSTFYTLTVGTGVKDSAGNALASAVTSSFTTAATPPVANYTVGGTVFGLSGTVVLQNNGGNNLSVSANSGFIFTTPIADGAAYNVTVLAQPTGQLCTVSNGSGIVGSANVTNVTVACVFIADVLIALDTSSSMSDEVTFVQNELNSFANAIRTSGIDLNVVVIATGSFCAGPPLGSGTCPNDQNLPGYRHVATAISSTDAFDVILATHAQWSASLRAGSRRSIIVVTDDNSATSQATFNTQLLALDANFGGYRFNSIVATLGPNSIPPNICTGIASAVGTEYIQLSNQTGGIVVNLCEQNFAPVFSNMASAIIASFP